MSHLPGYRLNLRGRERFSKRPQERNVFRGVRCRHQRCRLSRLLAVAFFPRTRFEDTKLPSTLTFTAYDTGSSGFNIAVAVSKALKDQLRHRRARAAGRQRCGAPRAVARRPRPDRASPAPAPISRRKACSSSRRATGARKPLQTHAVDAWTATASRSASPRTPAVKEHQGPQGQTRRLRRRRAGAQPDRARHARLRRPDQEPTSRPSSSPATARCGRALPPTRWTPPTLRPRRARVKEVEVSPRGLIWPPLPQADKAGWERMQKVGPFFVPHVATCGAGGLRLESARTCDLSVSAVHHLHR